MKAPSMRCRFCRSRNLELVLSLGMSPLANSNVAKDQLRRVETYLPLELMLCRDCHLVQLDECESPDNLFSDYAYFSSWSTSWLGHAKAYVDHAVERWKLGTDSRVVEIASNDGYLLQYFLEYNVPVLGIEPAQNIAKEAVKKGIPTRVEFWGAALAKELASESQFADLIIGNNVLAHVPDLNDFVAGLKNLLKPDGTVTMEFPHLYRLYEESQFDTIYHEHMSYFSFFVVAKVFAAHGLVLYDVDELPTHGGSLRIYAKHAEDGSKPIEDTVTALLAKERDAGMDNEEYYWGLGKKVHAIRRDLFDFLTQCKANGERVVAYGAPAKGNTLLNYCAIRRDYIDYTVDRNPYKQGMFTPGTRIPIKDPEFIREDRPDFVVILPWNLKDEIIEQMSHIREWGGKFVVAIPQLRVIE